MESEATIAIERAYLSRLRQYRLEGGPNSILYLGTKWFLMKVVLAALAALMFIGREETRYFGWFIAGYLLGTVLASMKTLLSLKRLWSIQNEITDWSIVDERLDRTKRAAPPTP